MQDTDNARTIRCRAYGTLDPGRDRVERFVADSYARAFGAALTQFMPRMLAFEDDESAIAAVVGVRGAGSHALFLEQYLDAPIERRIAAATGRYVVRDEIVEVGNFAGTSAGAVRRIILPVAQLLRGAGYRYVCFVATTPLRNAFARLGLAPRPLETADAGRLGEARAGWGSYFEHRPVVVYGDLVQAFGERVPVRHASCLEASGA